MSFDLRMGDCLDPITGLASLADKSVDHVICDPPYEAEAHTKGRRIADPRTGRIREAPISFAAMVNRDEAARAMSRVCRGWTMAFCQVEAVAAWRASLEAAGSKWRRAGLFIKPNGMPQLTGDRPAQCYETIAIAWSGEGKSSWNGGGKRAIYEHVVKGNFSREPRFHETEKPEELMEALVRDFTRPGDTVCDPFSGSGTTGVAAIRMGRKFIGWEKDPKYHAIAMKRLTAAREQIEMFK